MTANNLYLITNRSSALKDDVAPDGDLTYASYALCPWVPGDRPPTDATYTISDRPTVQSQMVTDLANLAVDGEVNLMIFILGFHTTWQDVQNQSGQWLTGLLGPAGHADSGYNGVQLSFDWPSGLDALDFDHAMANARTTAAKSLPQLRTFIEDLRSDPALSSITVNLQVLCHSMGNYLLQKGAAVFPANYFTQALLVAALLDYTSFNTRRPCETPCAAISAAAGTVSCYYSRYDDVLGLAAWLEDWAHNLGKDGPWDYLDKLAAGFVGLDCDAVINCANAQTYSAPLTHTAYFYIPETQMDMAAALLGDASAFRTAMPVTSQGYILSNDPSGST